MIQPDIIWFTLTAALTILTATRRRLTITPRAAVAAIVTKKQQQSTAQPREYNYRIRNIESTTNNFDYQASNEKYVIPPKQLPVASPPSTVTITSSGLSDTTTTVTVTSSTTITTSTSSVCTSPGEGNNYCGQIPVDNQLNAEITAGCLIVVSAVVLGIAAPVLIPTLGFGYGLAVIGTIAGDTEAIQALGEPGANPSSVIEAWGTGFLTGFFLEGWP